jgi:tRNA threonylcarbamoyladenosine biosynthesis protein TsaE
MNTPAKKQSYSVITRSPDETIALGQRLAGEFSAPRVVLLQGDLGAGKTTLVKGIAAALNAAPAENVTSPTFTLIHEYRGAAVSVFHIDLYRIDTERELRTLALDDLKSNDSILLIEWGEKFPQLSFDSTVLIEHLDETSRRITVTHLA